MKQLVENEISIELVRKNVLDLQELKSSIQVAKNDDVILFSLPAKDMDINRNKFIEIINTILSDMPEEVAVGIMGENEDLAYLSYAFETELKLKYQIWISLRKGKIDEVSARLPNETAGIVFFSRKKKLKFERVLLPYTYCPACNKTTKDYGGKKHTFHEFGTTMSDVWKDIYIGENDPFPEDILMRVKAMFSTESGKVIHVFSMNEFSEWGSIEDFSFNLPPLQVEESNHEIDELNQSTLFNGDSLEVLKEIPTSSIDYVFVDPPYNLKKKYASYDDALEIEEYFTWCDRWLEQCYRALKPGKFLTILNIPNWSIRHYAYLIQKMEFDSWVTWDSLSKPSGKVMPANYTLLTFKKPESESGSDINSLEIKETKLTALADSYCLRTSCKKKREPVFKEVTDLWTDIHRLKHNSQRYDHPCQLPPSLMQRLIKTFTKEDDFVLDCFNGVGTTTLTAHLLNRKYVGIELDTKYYETAVIRHNDINNGLDPFRKNQIENSTKTKNNDVKRIVRRRAEHSHITKKDVQMQMKELAATVGHAPTKEEALIYLPEVPEEFYDLYFSSWAEVITSVKVGGVTETLKNYKGNVSSRREDTIVEEGTGEQMKFQLLKQKL
ncbi:DNA-methyltransferase [Planococcus kocurii]|uniref:DNA-methyltransferase n=1 Tax=Planococcus kocurii TaxID=1374 RepID=UPI003D07619B